MKRVWLVTGASRGLGRAVAEVAIERGQVVNATARDTRDLADLLKRFPNDVTTLRLDVTKPETIEASVGSTLSQHGRIDVLINNAGSGLIGAFEETSPEQFDASIGVNFFGAVRVTRAVLPAMRRQRSGRILQVSSVFGRFGSPGLSAYHAAKAALTSFSESLAYEVKGLGIRVIVAEPGGIQTDWGTRRSLDVAEPMRDYEAPLAHLRSLYGAQTKPAPNRARDIAQAICDLIEAPAPPVRVLLGRDALNLSATAAQHRRREDAAWRPFSASLTGDHAERQPEPR